MPEKLFNKYFIGVTVLNFVVYLVYYLLMVIIAVIAQDDLGASMSEAGFASGIYIIGTLLARLLMGKQIELLGRKFVLRASALFYLATTVCYLFIPSLGILYLIRFLNGFGYGAISTATNTIVTAYIPQAKNGEGINYYGLSTSLAAAAGPFLGMLLLSATNFEFIIWLSISLILAVAIACFLFPVKNIQLSAEHKAAIKSWNFSSFIEKKALFITFIAFLMGLAYSSVLSFLSSYVKVIDLVSAGSFFFVVYALVITFTRPVTGRIFDAKGEQYVMYPSYIFLAAGLLLLGVTTNNWTLLISGAFVGLGYGTFMSNGQAVCLKLVNTHRIGVALSTYFIGLDLGLGVGPYIMGILKNATSFRGLYLIASVIPLICAILYWINHKMKSKKWERTGASLEQVPANEERI
ncbi:MFS transporter [Listeria kieliensis]